MPSNYSRCMPSNSNFQSLETMVGCYTLLYYQKSLCRANFFGSRGVAYCITCNIQIYSNTTPFSNTVNSIYYTRYIQGVKSVLLSYFIFLLFGILSYFCPTFRHFVLFSYFFGIFCPTCPTFWHFVLLLSYFSAFCPTFLLF